MGPERIRALRGKRSRADLARELGVTPLTVLRWELPDGNKEARRPRKAMIEILERIEKTQQGEGSQVAKLAELAHEDPDLAHDMTLLLPVRTVAMSESWRRAQDELLSLLASNRLKTPSGRALATLAIAQLDLIARLDVRGALTAVMPLLAEVEAEKLPLPIAARVHVAAASLFSAPDVRLFDPGRVNAHAAAAARLLVPTDDEWVILALARLSSTRFLGTEVFIGTYRELETLDTEAPIPRCLLQLMKALGAELVGDRVGSRDLSVAALSHATQLGLYAIVVGVLANNITFDLARCVPASEVLTQVARARAAAQEGRLGPIEPLIRVLSGECSALTRLGRFDEAKAVTDEARDLARRAGVPPYAVAAAEARVRSMTRDREGLVALAAALEQEVAPSMRALVRGHLLHVQACVASVDGDFARSAELADQAWEVMENLASADHAMHEILNDGIIARVLMSDVAGAQLLLGRFDALNHRLPSRWHAATATINRGMLLLVTKRPQEAIEVMASAKPDHDAAGDVVMPILTRGATAMVRRSMGDPGGDAAFASAMEEARKIGFVPRPFAGTVGASRAEAAKENVDPEPTVADTRPLAERFQSAAARLTSRDRQSDVVRTELVGLAENLFPGKRAILQDPDRPSSFPPARGEPKVEQWFELTDDRGKVLRFGVEGSVDQEQAAVLRALTSVARRGLRETARRDPAAGLALEPDVLPELPHLVAAGPRMQKLRRSIAQLSGSRATILITGESGSGKEVVARAIHDLSTRAPRPYIAFNCASIPRDLFEGQLFGHKRGAFTGADSDQLGVIRAADKGTLFLDEIGELPLDVQPKLLRFLENGEVFPLGERQPVKVDVRVLAATHRDLLKLVRERTFREDLFYRLNVVPLEVPPLRERPEDVIALATRFIVRFTPEGVLAPTLSPEALEALADHDWPGNVRELRNVVERTMAFGVSSPVLKAEDLRFG